jgi:hypothetical protein
MLKHLLACGKQMGQGVVSSIAINMSPLWG